ncbi:hypothetical protein Pelo_18776 [Pelomyxa schiedti]|nr:hypothetical protein Pelo_18776 [Pelomyxa schiedti]
MAKQLVDGGGDGGDDGRWSGCRLLTWPKDDPTLIDDIREMPVKTKEIPHSLLYLACKGGNLDVVKWVMSKFRGVGTEPWELLMAFHAAVRWGHLNVVKWLASTTGVIAACTKKGLRDYLTSVDYADVGELIASQNLEVTKFCVSLFSRGRLKGRVLPQFVAYCSSASESESELREGWDQIRAKFRVPSCPDFSFWIKNAKAFRWYIENSSDRPREKDLKVACTDIADDELVEWLLRKQAGTVGSVTTPIFVAACGNSKDSVSLMEFLLTHVARALSQKDIVEGLVVSLYHNNTSVADWLESTFHVMDHVNATPSVTEQVFKKICNSGETECVAGVQWPALLLWNTFNVYKTVSDSAVIEGIVEHCALSAAKKFMHGQFSLSDIVHGLSHSWSVQSGKPPLTGGIDFKQQDRLCRVVHPHIPSGFERGSGHEATVPSGTQMGHMEDATACVP